MKELLMPHEFNVEAGLVVFSRDGRPQFGWLDLVTGEYHAESDGRCITDAIGAIAFQSDVMH
ncbi:hypothetical protein A9R05_40270 (plasmid) [Burkholderia sp. KK1]|nr:hypothetical protein A9R05_40270 [Burkholderia sp. KK1]